MPQNNRDDGTGGFAVSKHAGAATAPALPRIDPTQFNRTYPESIFTKHAPDVPHSLEPIPPPDLPTDVWGHFNAKTSFKSGGPASQYNTNYLRGNTKVEFNSPAPSTKKLPSGLNENPPPINGGEKIKRLYESAQAIVRYAQQRGDTPTAQRFRAVYQEVVRLFNILYGRPLNVEEERRLEGYETLINDELNNRPPIVTPSTAPPPVPPGQPQPLPPAPAVNVPPAPGPPGPPNPLNIPLPVTPPSTPPLQPAPGPPLPPLPATPPSTPPLPPLPSPTDSDSDSDGDLPPFADKKTMGVDPNALLASQMSKDRTKWRLNAPVWKALAQAAGTPTTGKKDEIITNILTSDTKAAKQIVQELAFGNYNNSSFDSEKKLIEAIKLKGMSIKGIKPVKRKKGRSKRR